MKKLWIIALLAVSINATAQSSRQIKATFSDGYVVKHEVYTPSFQNDGKPIKVRNVILMIGDGMGFGALNSGMYANDGKLSITQLQSIGLVRTQSASDFVTDSAASASAYACGQKTTNGYIGITPEGEHMANIPEKLTPLGYACGVVTTDWVCGATPAAFYAHTTKRMDSAPIWGQLPLSQLLFVGGGNTKQYTMLNGDIQESIAENYTVVTSLEDENVKSSKRLLYVPEEMGEDGRLAETVKVAVNYLSERSKKGFFLMVEESDIDIYSHGNNMHKLASKVMNFDKAVEAAIRFAEKDGHTLVIITADHDTGMLSVKDVDNESAYVSGHFAHRGHSAMMVPLFAYGPYSEKFSIILENSDVGNLITSLLK